MGLYFSFYLFKLGLAPPIQDLYGKVNFTGMVLCGETWAGSCRGGFATDALGSCGRRDVGSESLGCILPKLPQGYSSQLWGFSASTLGLAGEWGLCWLSLLQYWAAGLVLSSVASALLQRRRSTT